MNRVPYDWPIRSEPARRNAARWLLLGLLSLVGAGLFAMLLVLARTPKIQDFLPVEDFFRVALVVHVNLSVLIWLLSVAGVLWSLSCRTARPAWDGSSFVSCLAGAALLSLSPFFGAADPLMNNYVPVLQHPVFFLGLALFAVGVSSQAVRSIAASRREGPLDGAGALRQGARLAALITVIAVVCVPASLAGIPDGMNGLAFFEFLFWGGGHVLQFAHTLLMMLAWIVLASASGCRFPLSPRVTVAFVLILAMPVVTVPFLYLAHEVVSAGHRIAFTELMKYGGLSCLPLGLAVVSSFRGADACTGEARHLRAALVASIVLFATGGVIGFMISGLDIMIPAHYHGSTVGVTIAFMGLAYYLLPRLGFGPVPGGLATWQPLIYAGGQLLHIAGLAWTGGYGVQRKTAGLAQGVDRLGEIAGMGLMGLGGLVSVIGGLLFLVVAWHSIRARPGAPPPAGTPDS